MRRLEQTACARAGLAGNPSDGYFGKTLSVSIRDFTARVVIYEWPTLEILPCQQDHVKFNNLASLAKDVKLNGYYGGLRLVKASLKKFHDYCQEHSLELPEENFTIRYETEIPRQVGLAGSSAIITATFRALMSFYEIDIPPWILANWVLATERDELGINAGLQDRVCQAYDGLVYMDFNVKKMETDGFGYYEPLDPALLPPLYLAYQTRLSKVSGMVFNNLRERWEKGDPQVLDAMKGFADLTDRAKDSLTSGDMGGFSEAINANFDLRKSILNISKDNMDMVETARQCGASAKFAGSGGAIVGTYPDDKTYSKLEKHLTELGCRVLKASVIKI
jgi:glucuronokinase